MRRRGQITIFLIIGILIFLSIFVVFLIRNIVIEGAIEPEIREGLSLPQQLDSVNSYVGYCIRQESKPSIERTALFGGTFDMTNRIEYNAERVNVLCKQKTGKGCVQNLLLKEQVEDELSKLIAQRLLLCIDLLKFEEKGYQLTYNPLDLKVNAKIGVEDVSVIVNYPISLAMGSSVLKTEQYLEKVNMPFGRVYELAIDIINKEIEQGYFNKDEWMAKDPTIIIEKHKPYPNIIYELKKNSLVFKFAIAGIDTVGKYLPEPNPAYGCCVADDMCYLNVQPGSCEGEYDESCSCKVRSQPSRAAVNYSNCGDREHGESWCEYGGGDVGSRHYKYSCINGKELVEECRDYRDELCTEQNNKAVCRVNRWQDCYKCATEECCEDSEWRDCAWNLDLKTEIKCVPQVPPGLKFWESSQICAVGNEKKENPDKKWIDSTAILCNSLGDCGNGYNTAGRLTKNGFVNTAGRENENVYGQVAVESISLPLDARKQAVLASGEYEDISVSAQHLADFLNSINVKGDESSKSSFSKCNLWIPPTRTDDCKLCGADGNVCSEYSCKSLDENCIYTESLGIPTCETPKTIDRVPPKIFIDEDALSEGYSASNANINNWYDGYEVLPAIKPHRPITVGIRTSEETRCKITYLPENDFKILPPYWFGDSNYRQQHSITLRLPSATDVVDRLMASLNLSSLESILDLPGFLIQPIARLAALKLLDEFNLGNYYIFVKCNDKPGNVNDEEFFIKFKINESYVVEPKIVATKPENNAIVPFGLENVSLKLYLNKPSECRASSDDVRYGDMEMEFECVTSEYEISSVGNGTYLCEAELPFEEMYYLNCLGQNENYVFYLTQAEELVITNLEPAGEISTTSPKLAVETSGDAENVECSYSSGREYFAMSRVNSTFTAQIEELEENKEYRYDLVCEDNFGNHANSEIVFTVIT